MLSDNNLINEIYPNKGENKEDFIARFMKVTKKEYPDIKQRYAVANSYWDRRNRNLDEAKRYEIIDKSKKGDLYKNSKHNRWTKKSDATIANTVKDYNKIDMNSFWKDDVLVFGIKVKGLTDEYLVHISFKNILDKLQKAVINNKNKLTPELIYNVLTNVLNSEDVKFNCSCPDYNYRLKYFASKNKYNQGKSETRPSNITNPDDTKGAACKHILAVLNNLEWLRKIASVINNYVNYYKDNLQYNYSRFIFPKLYGMSYNKAIQMTLDDYDETGNEVSDLKSDESLINLSNALGKVRGRFKKKN